MTASDLGFKSIRWGELLLSTANCLQVALAPHMVQQFAAYGEQLQRWNRKMNLTAITEPGEIALKHFADSLAAIPLLSPEATILDMGSGAGFPGLCLKIARPDLQITLIDAARKRVSFLKFMISYLELPGIQAEHSRIENLDDAYQGHFDIAVSRAVTSLAELAGWAKPWLRSGGRLIAWKGQGFQSEIVEMEKQGSRISNSTPWQCRVVPYRLGTPGQDRYLIMITEIS